ncbi:Uncharacterised protein [Enterococcus malodoratus]|uniref:Uncharacterized protein n=1 Tax=Enterococcus malodoratus ATCC 43197 TaxID=1158601 RepID=R2RJV9_9ENTE|nr:hypothetical protein UAI_00940 [Enterococcus malodoratus ATCC 43197]EOT69405.1 hypothetical protein I585_00871 [Enterococcus malodoratus ATCC 43197]SPX01043.1 Uncharacterised protein [Enterococcus malodoratus]STC71241.1 Uncharacterised protein [Enterococcus malodoratus]
MKKTKNLLIALSGVVLILVGFYFADCKIKLDN